jgi:glycosyltransferase involved in cell wall biosynthesis
MNIAILTSSYPRYAGDGVGSFVKSLAESLVALDHEVHVLAPYDPAVRPDVTAAGRCPQVQRFRYIWPDSLALVGHARSLEADVRLRPAAYGLIPFWSLAAGLRLVQTVRRHPIDVIYAQWILPSGLVGAAVAELTGRPLVIHLHGSDVYVAASNPLFRTLTRWSFGRAERVIACSRDLGRRAIAIGLEPAKSHVIPYGVDTIRYEPGEADDQLRTGLGLPAGAPVVMAMGRLVYKKGFEFLIRAAPAITAAFPDARFLIAGDGDLARPLAALANDLGVADRIIFPGHISWQDGHRYLRLADILVVPSVVDAQGNVDGLPNVLLEAMATGCPLVASHVAGIPDVIRDGENGLLVPEKEPEALAAAIIELLESPDLRRALGMGARQTAATELDWGRTALRVAAVLQAAGARG